MKRNGPYRNTTMVAKQVTPEGTMGPNAARNSRTDGAVRLPGRPRSVAANRAILEATRDLLVEEGFTRLLLEHVAVRAGVGKGTIYRRWASKDALSLELV